MHRNKKNVIIVSMIAAVLVMIIGFAAFQTNLMIKGTSGVTGVWGIEITSIEYAATGGAHIISTPTYSGTNATLNTGLRKPGDKMVYTIKVENTGTVDAIIQSVNIDVSGSAVIVYKIEGIENESRLGKGESKNLILSVEFDSLATSIPSENTKEININIMAIQDDGQTLNPSNPTIDQELLLAKRILSDNTALSDENIDFSTSGNDTGLYYTSTNTEGNKTTYFFRGLVENNYVQLGTYDTTLVAGMMNGGIFSSMDECLADGLEMDCQELTTTGDPILWRIVRINEDGSVRIITDNPVGTSEFNSKDDDNAYVGYMYGTPVSDTYEKTHANINESEIKKYLDNWYITILGEYGDITSNEAGFCNDRSVATTANTWNSDDTALGYSKNITYYGAYSRNSWQMDTVNPQFKCPQTNDLFTMSTSSNGNKKLSQPIGLITFDEVIYAGGLDIGASSSYIYGPGVMFWQMSPYSFENESVYTNQVNGNTGMSGQSFVRPVINLKADLEFTLEGTGDAGTSTNPYIIKTN